MQEKKSYFRTIKSLLGWMCCLGCCKQPILLVDLIGSVSIHFLREYVECMVVLIRINNFQDLLVNLRLKSTCDDRSKCMLVLCIYLLLLYISSLSFVHVYWIILNIRKKNFKEIPKILYSLNGQYKLSLFFSDQWTSMVSSNCCTSHDSKMDKVYPP